MLKKCARAAANWALNTQKSGEKLQKVAGYEAYEKPWFVRVLRGFEAGFIAEKVAENSVSECSEQVHGHDNTCWINGVFG